MSRGSEDRAIYRRHKRAAERIASSDFWMDGVRVLDYALVGNRVWTAIRAPSGKRAVVLVTLSFRSYGERFTWRITRESAPPRSYDCPVRLFDVAGPTDDARARRWRSKVWALDAVERERAAERRKLPKIEPGSLVQWKNMTCRVMYARSTPHKRFNGWIVEDESGRRRRAVRGVVPLTA